MATPAGWYPTSDGRQRYWDGEMWTEHFAPGGPGGSLVQFSQPAYPPMGQPLQVAPKSPALALLASFFVPGLGSMIIGRVGIGVTILVCYFVSFLLIFVLIGIPLVIGLWIWGMVDAYTGAQNWNARHGIIS
ncbi:MAG TPA: DUF2510 domain-containing protein [Dermatophilaceae bacterium]|nr:DUF2510 domain-containing protein [Dermatophilaceae bacterium]